MALEARGRAGYSWVHLDNKIFPVSGCTELDIGTTCFHTNCNAAKDMSKTLVFTIGEGLCRCNGYGVSRMNTHRIKFSMEQIV